MNKKLKWALIIVAVLALIVVGGGTYMQSQTKKASPEGTAEYTKNGKQISVFYCRPSVRGRVIFDSLVPYGQVWRTGANEATTFTTATDLTIGDKALKAGKYSVWTVPGKDSWNFILNSKEYGWGVSFGGVASREPEADVLNISVPVLQLPEKVELFTISFEDDSANVKLLLDWDKTRVAVPIK